MTTEDSLSKASPKKTHRTSLIPEIGPALARQAWSEVMAAISAPIEKPSSYGPSNMPEKERVRLGQKIEKYIQRRLRKQTQADQLSKEIGLSLKILRLNLGWTLAEVAHKLDFSFAFLHDIELGKRPITLIHLHKLMLHYGHNISHLILSVKTGH